MKSCRPKKISSAAKIVGRNQNRGLLVLLAFLFCATTASGAGNPSNQPTAIVITSRTVNSMTVSFTDAIGGANGYLLIYKVGSSPTNGAPVDGVTYNVGNSLGGGFVGAKGTSPFTITGLTAGQQYFFDIYSYNGAGGGINYLQSVAPLEGSAWTLAAAPTAQPTGLTFNTISSTAFNGVFTAAAPVPTGYVILRSAAAGATDLPVDGALYSVGTTIGGSKVAFIGPSLTFSESGLTPGTAYYYQVFSYGEATDPSTVNYYTSGAPLSNNQTTLATPPGAQATSIVFSGITNNQLTITWTSGTGARRIVLAHAGAAVNSNPVNATTYTANAAFASGSQIGTGNYTVYDGIGNTIAVTALNPSTLYYFEVFEYNGTLLTANYLTSVASGNPANQTTLATAAFVQASNILFSAVSDVQMTLTWTPGNGARRLVLGHLGAAVNSNPINGIGYTANAFFNSGTQIGAGNYVVYDGTGSSVTVTGLTSSTVFFFEVFEYNGAGPTANYLTAAAVNNPASQTTIASPATVQAGNIVFSGITDNQLSLTWTNGNGGRRIVLGHAGTAVNSTPLNSSTYIGNAAFGSGSQVGSGNFAVYDGTANTVIVTGLAATTVYYFEVFEYNGTGLTANYTTTAVAGNPANQTTVATPATTQASALTFSGVSNSQLTLNWTNGTGTRRVILAQAGALVNANPVNGITYSANTTFSSGTQIGTGNYVVYDGTGNSVAVTALTASTVYNFQVFEYTGTATTTNYLTSTTAGNPAGQITLAAPVTTQATSILFSGMTTTSMTLNWTIGSGTSRLVLAHAGSAVNSNPVSATTYAADPSFGLGAQIGIGNYTVYNGTGSAVTVTGLVATTVYYFEVYEYNGTALTANYLIVAAAGNPANQTTLATPASTQATNILFSGVSDTQVTLNWTNGNGARRVILGHAGALVNSNPVNGTTYPANTQFTSGTQIGIGNYVVYDGTGNSITVTGLTAGTVYNFQVFDYNGTTNTTNYLTSTAAGNPAGQITLAAPVITQATSILFSGMTTTSMTLNWTIGSGASRLVLVHAGSAVNSNPVNATTYAADPAFGSGAQIGTGNYAVYSGAGNAVTVTGLVATTVYYFEVYEYNGTALTANYFTAAATGNPANQTTLAAPASTQSTNILFSGITDTQMTANWTNGNGSRRIVLVHAGVIVNSNPLNGTTYTASPTFSSGTQIGVGNYVVYDGTGSSVTVSGLTAATVYNFQVFEYNGSSATTNYLSSTASGNPLGQITLAAPASVQATSILFSALTTTSMTLNWTNGNGTSRLVLAHAGSAVNSNPLNATTYAADPAFGIGAQIGTGNYVVYSGAGNTVTVAGLAATTVYYFEVFEYTGTALTANYLIVAAAGNPANTTTLAAPATTQATNILFSGVSDTQMTLTWMNGNGARRIILAQAAVIVNSIPLNGTTYVASTTFTSGTQIGTGNYVVYDGTGTSVTVTGLSASTVYNFQVFEYNGSAATTNYLASTAAGNPAGRITLASPVLIQATSILFSSVTTTSITLNWTNGNGTSRLVLAHAGSAVNSNPLNATTYAADPAFGLGAQIGAGNYVVFSGTGNTVTVAALAATTVYFFEVFEYNGTALTANYMVAIAAGNPANKTTLATPATTQATNISFTAVSNTQLTLNWTNGNGARRIVLGHSGVIVDSNPVSGTAYTASPTFSSGSQIGAGNYVVYDGTGNSATVSGLSASTVYNFQVFEYNGVATTINYLTSTAAGNPAGQITLANSATVQAQSISFSNLTANTMTVGWTNGDGARRILVAHAGATINSSPVDGTGYTANANFGSGTQIGIGNYVVYDGTGSSIPVTGLSAITAYYFEVYEYNGSGLTSNYLTTTAAVNPSSQLTLDNPPTSQATNIVFSSISDTGFTIAWTNGAGANRLVLVQAGSQFNDIVGNGVDYPANSIFGLGTQVGSHFVVYNGPGNSVAITSLSPSTVYYVEVIEYSGAGMTANYLTSVAAGNPANQSTLTAAVTSQDSNLFFSTVLNNSATLGWSNGNGARRIVLAHAGAPVDANPMNATSYGASAAFGTGAQIGTGNYVIYDGTGSTTNVTGLLSSSSYYFEVFGYNGSGADNNYNTSATTGNTGQLLTLPDAPVVIAVLASGSTSFAASWLAIPGSTGYRVDISTDNFSTFVTGYSDFLILSTTLGVSPLTPGTIYQIRVRAQNATGPSANSNVVSVLTQPAIPQALPATSVTANTFVAHWTYSTGATNYFLDVSSDINFLGLFIPGFNNLNIAGTNLEAVTGLSAGTIYYYRMRAVNASGTSSNSQTITQITVPATPTAEDASSEQSNSFLANWTMVQGADTYELDVTLSSANFSKFVTGYDSLAIPSSQTEEIVNGLTPNTIYKYRVRARNSAGVSASSFSKVVLTSGGAIQPLSINASSSTNSTINVLASGGFNSATNTITLLHRKITGTVFTQEPDVTGSSANIPVNPAWLDPLGMEYYIRVKDEAEKEDSTSSFYVYATVSNINLASQSNFTPGGTSESYRIFSIPLILASTRIEDVFQPIEAQFGGIDKTKWRLVHYEGGQNIDYGAGLSNIDPGTGYWFNSLDAPLPIFVSGSVTHANQASGFIMTLDAGFTQIGNPYPFDIVWSDVLAQNPTVAGIAGVGSLYTYDAEHVTFTKDADILKAWEGGFVHSNTPIQITIPVTVKQSPGARKDADLKRQTIDQPQWFVPIRISQGVTYNNYSGPGMHPDAQPGYDRFDDFTVPRFTNYLEMNSYHAEYQTPRFSRDIVPTADHYNWTFDVESSFDDRQAVMTWDNQALGDNEAQLLLYDVESNTIIDMKKESSYSFEITQRHSFRIFFGSTEKNVAPDVSGLGRAYPNPFTQRTTIPFITSADQPDVQIVMYDLMGRQLGEVVSGRFEPGYHEGTWDGVDNQGGRAAQGVYIYRLTGNHVSPQMGRVILKY